jgi:heparan-alpha-glucosaminide N-acetyltransferase
MTAVASDNRPPRITSIDALRGFVMFMMIFVNDLAGAPEKLVPDWMVHFSDRHKRGSGMTFVDLVFPGFLFLVGMSIPFALGPRLARGEPLWKIISHVATRTLALLTIGILMVNGESKAEGASGWSPTLWEAEMFLSAILAFCSVSPPNAALGAVKFWKILSLCLRVIGIAGMIYCAFAFQGRDNHPVITLSPLHIHTSWYGILGLIGWSYFVGSIIFLVFRTNRTALLGCLALLLCLYSAGRKGMFDGFWLSNYIGIGEMIGAHPAITVAGLLLASILVSADMTGICARVKFTLLFSAGCAAAALLVNSLYGISKNSATPSWCLWSCAITAILWLIFYFLADVRKITFFSQPLAIAGQNVLLAYLLSEAMGSWLELAHLGDWYDHLSEGSLAGACARSIGCGVVILAITALLNRLGFRLKL